MTTTSLYAWPLWCACSFSGCEWAYCHGTLLCDFSIPNCAGVLKRKDQNRAEKQNVVLTWFRPVTWSSGHLGRRSLNISGNVQIVSRTLSGLFLVGVVNRPRKRKRTSRENPRRVPGQIGKIPEKSGKDEKGQKRKDRFRSGNPFVETSPFSGPKKSAIFT